MHHIHLCQRSGALHFAHRVNLFHVIFIMNSDYFLQPWPVGLHRGGSMCFLWDKYRILNCISWWFVFSPKRLRISGPLAPYNWLGMPPDYGHPVPNKLRSYLWWPTFCSAGGSVIIIWFNCLRIKTNETKSNYNCTLSKGSEYLSSAMKNYLAFSGITSKFCLS
jgi:hypothetical protein